MAKTLQHQIIARAVELISDERRWTVGAMARNTQRQSCAGYTTEAVRFCAIGALTRAVFELLGPPSNPDLVDQIEAMVLAANGLERTNLACINDRQGREAILELLRKALVGISGQT